MASVASLCSRRRPGALAGRAGARSLSVQVFDRALKRRQRQLAAAAPDYERYAYLRDEVSPRDSPLPSPPSPLSPFPSLSPLSSLLLSPLHALRASPTLLPPSYRSFPFLSLPSCPFPPPASRGALPGLQPTPLTFSSLTFSLCL
eukprot:scaffold50791_cov26-Tisochrysis_lutea.AAC.6